jgi:hypothetical protein
MLGDKKVCQALKASRLIMQGFHMFVVDTAEVFTWSLIMTNRALCLNEDKPAAYG